MSGSTSLVKLRWSSALPSWRDTPSRIHSSKRSATVLFSAAWRSASAMVAAIAAWASILAALRAAVGLIPLEAVAFTSSRSVRICASDFLGQLPRR